MTPRTGLYPRFIFLTLLAALLLGWTGCAPGPRPGGGEPVPARTGKRVIFLGFEAALPPGSEPQVARNPVSGSLFMAEPVPPEAPELLETMLMQRISRLGDEVIILEESVDILSGVRGEDVGAELTPLEILGELGEKMEADGVLIGHVYRWREREGSEFAVDRPASAAFDLILIRSSDNALAWRGKFDRTQMSLSENLFDFAGFLERRGRWVKVEDFAAGGLDAMLEGYPGVSGGEG